MMRIVFQILLCILILSELSSQQLPPGFVLEKVAEGLNPTTFTFGPLDRIYIADKSGKVWIVNEMGELLSEPLINIEVDDFDERGLGGVAFHPRFDEFPFVYLYYTVKGANHNRLSRFLVNGDRAIPGTEEILLDFNLVNGFIHNAGRIFFDQEEYLYVSTGDGAEQWNAQSLDNLLGKVLRLNPDGSIPEDNPFYEIAEGMNKAIWAYGLRNPFSMDYHQITGKIFAGEVGLGTWEEVNEILPGKNYGWPRIEGFRQDQVEPDHYQEPRHAYHHNEGCAIIGVTILDQPTTYPEEYKDAIFFADYCNGYIKYLDQHTDHSHDFATGFELPVDLQVAPDGNLYVITRKGKGINSTQDNTRVENGVLWRIRYQGDGPPRIAQQPIAPRLAIGEAMILDINAFGTPPLYFKWYSNDQLLQESTQPVVRISNPSALSAYYCIVSNEYGRDTSIHITPDIINGSRPVAYIVEPAADFYAAGDTISFLGYGTDLEDDSLSKDQLTWGINFHHNIHYHPSLGPISGISGGQLITPTTAETDTQVWYRVNLTVIDSDGLTHSTYKDLFPKKHTLSFNGPKDIPLNIDGIQLPMPGKLSTVSGVVRTLQAPKSYQVNDTFYVFKQWRSYGSDNLLVRPFHEDQEFEVIYDRVALGTGSGLIGTYYPGIQEGPTGEGFVRIDSIIDFVWENSPYWPDIPDDRFTIVWTGELQPLLDGSYFIKTFTDDGVRVWIGNDLIIDAWKSRRSTQDIAKIDLEAGKRYPIIVQYFEDLSQAVAQLHWSHELIRSQIIPAKQLYPKVLKVPGKVQIFPFHDINSNGKYEVGEPFLNDGQIVIHSGTDTITYTLNGKPIQTYLQPGSIDLHIDKDKMFLRPNADVQSQLSNISINSADSINMFIPFVLKESSFEGVAWTIKPNPIGNNLKLYYQNKIETMVTISLRSIQGSEIFSDEVLLEGPYGIIERTLGDLASGVYLFTMEINGRRKTHRLVKQ